MIEFDFILILIGFVLVSYSQVHISFTLPYYMTCVNK